MKWSIVVTDADVTEAEHVIDRSGLVEFFEDRLRAAHPRGGRPGELPLRTMLIGFLLLAKSGKLHITRLDQLLRQLPQHHQIRLGVHRPANRRINRKQVERLFNNVIATLDPSEHLGGAGLEDEELAERQGALQEFCDRLLDATMPAGAAATTFGGSLALDTTSVDSWARRRRRLHTGARPDPDAEWNGRATPWKAPVYGYGLHLLVRTREEGGVLTPAVAQRMILTGAAHEPIAPGLAMLRDLSASQGLSDVLVDRGYTADTTGDDFLNPVRALGGNPIFDLTKTQRGPRGSVNGAVIVDGQPYSPGMPDRLRNLTPPPIGSPWADIDAYQQQVAIREQYALVAHGRPKADGTMRLSCPAAAGRVICAHKPTSLQLPPSAHPMIYNPPDAMPAICAQKTVTFDPTQMPLWQSHPYGSAAWYQSYQRRNLVEGFNGNVKDEASAALRRGNIRVMGLAKMTWMCAFAVAATNMRLLHTWADAVAKHGPYGKPSAQQRRAQRAAQYAPPPGYDPFGPLDDSPGTPLPDPVLRT